MKRFIYLFFVLTLLSLSFSAAGMTPARASAGDYFSPVLNPPRISLSGPFAPTPEAPQAIDAPITAVPTWVDPSTRQTSRDFYLNQYLSSENVPANWTGDHATCNAGTTSADFKAAVLRRINYFRAMAGMPDLLSLSDSSSLSAQSAALMMSVNGQLSHSPPTNWTCYTPEGAQGAGKSNLSLGSYGPAAISRYIMDSGNSNYFIGHRRWVLYPLTQQMGTGDIPPSGGYSASNALWVIGDFGPRPATREPYVAWPPRGYVPYQVVYSRWSFSYPNADFTAATVTMLSGGTNVPLTQESVVSGYGDSTLVWRPYDLASGNPWPKPANDSTYSVTVGNVLIGGVPQTFTYDVTVFDPDVAGAPTHAVADFNGDGKTDVSIFRPSNGIWYVKDQFAQQYGGASDIPISGDYNGDGKTEVAVFRPSNGIWYISGGTSVQYGGAGDIPVPGDYNGDGQTDVAVFRPSNGVWYVKGQFSQQYGGAGDIPVPGDYNGDGQTDVAVFRPSNGMWYVNGQFAVQYGGAGDIPIPGDYNGDGNTDVAVFRPSNGVWYVNGQFNQQWGGAGDIPVPGDYNGDNVSDVAVWRPSNGTWYVNGQFSAQYGGAGDFPCPTRDTNGDGDPYQDLNQ